MSEDIIYLSIERVIALHDRIMERMDKAAVPLRSAALLESAVLRPQHLAHYQSADLVEQAAVLAIGISQNQPFLDGNKRTAFTAMSTFLELNGFRIGAQPLEIARQLERVAERSGELDAASDDFAAWLRERLTPLDG